MASMKGPSGVLPWCMAGCRPFPKLRLWTVAGKCGWVLVSAVRRKSSLCVSGSVQRTDAHLRNTCVFYVWQATSWRFLATLAMQLAVTMRCYAGKLRLRAVRGRMGPCARVAFTGWPGTAMTVAFRYRMRSEYAWLPISSQTRNVTSVGVTPCLMAGEAYYWFWRRCTARRTVHGVLTVGRTAPRECTVLAMFADCRTGPVGSAQGPFGGADVAE